MDILLPTKLKNEIKNIGLTKAGINHAVNFYQLYLRELTFTEDNCDKNNNYVNIPSGTMKELFTSDYCNMFLDALLDNKIVTRTPFYYGLRGSLYKSSFKRKNKKNKCFGYRFESKFLDFTDTTYCSINKRLKQNQKANEKYHIGNLKNIVFDFNKMRASIESFNVEDEIRFPNVNSKEIYQIKFKNGSSYYYTGKKILKKIDDGISFFEFRNQYYVDDLERFVTEKKHPDKVELYL